MHCKHSRKKSLSKRTYSAWEEGNYLYGSIKVCFLAKRTLRPLWLSCQILTLSQSSSNTWQANNQEFMPNRAKQPLRVVEALWHLCSN